MLVLIGLSEGLNKKPKCYGPVRNILSPPPPYGEKLFLRTCEKKERKKIIISDMHIKRYTRIV